MTRTVRIDFKAPFKAKVWVLLLCLQTPVWLHLLSRTKAVELAKSIWSKWARVGLSQTQESPAA